MVYIGIDVGGTGIKIGVVDEQGQLIHQGETPTLVGRPYQEIIADMGRCALKVLDEAKTLLMERNGMTEEEAHHYIQKCSMDSGTNLIETAEMVLSMMRY